MQWNNYEVWSAALRRDGASAWNSCTTASWVVRAASYSTMPKTLVIFGVSDLAVRAVAGIEAYRVANDKEPRPEETARALQGLQTLQGWCLGVATLASVRATEKALRSDFGSLNGHLAAPGVAAQNAFRAADSMESYSRSTSYSAMHSVDTAAAARSGLSSTSQYPQAMLAIEKESAEAASLLCSMWRWEGDATITPAMRVALDLAEETLGREAIVGLYRGKRRVAAPQILLVRGTREQAGERVSGALEQSGFTPCATGWVWMVPVGQWF